MKRSRSELLKKRLHAVCIVAKELEADGYTELASRLFRQFYEMYGAELEALALEEGLEPIKKEENIQ